MHYLNLGDFIKYYNGLKSTQVALEITSPHQIFDPRNSGPDFEFHFPYDAQWVLQLSYEDLTPKLPPVFTTQYNLSLPLGFIFDPQVKNAFPMVKEFSLLDKEKEIAADFNESRPHHLLRAYEQKVFNSAVALADNFFAVKNFPPSASGARDLLRGMAYEIALISTSQTYLLELFKEDAFWIATQRNKADLAKGGKEKLPSDKELEEIAIELSNTLRKSLFPYFLKATLADLFKQLHPYEQQLLKSLPKSAIKSFCLHATKIANGGVGNSKDHHAHLLSTHDTFMEMFEVFYDQTFNQVAVGADFAPTDPIGCLTDRFIPPVDLGSRGIPLKALVVELRVPAQGKQHFEDIEKMCKSFGATHQQILKESYSKKVQSDLDLDVLAQPKISKRKKPTPDTEQPDTLMKPSAVKAKKFAEPLAGRSTKKSAEPTKGRSPLATQSMFHHKRITRATEASKTKQIKLKEASSTRRANEIDKDSLTSNSNKRMKH